MKDLPVKKKLIAGAVAVAVVVLLVIVILPGRERTSSHCLTHGVGAQQMSTTFFPDMNLLGATSGDIAYTLDDWCTQVPDESTQCRCEWTIDKLVFDGDMANLIHQPATAYLSIPLDSVPTAVSFNFDFEEVVYLDDGGVTIVEGTTLWIDFHDLDSVPQLLMEPGGLCVVDDIDGADPDPKHHQSAPQKYQVSTLKPIDDPKPRP